MKTVSLFIISSFFTLSIFSQLDANSLLGIPTVNSLSDLSTITPNVGSIFYETSTNKIHKYTATGWRSLQLNLQDVLAENNSANNGTITDLATPTTDNDAATKKYVDDTIVTQHVSICEFLTEETIIERTSGGQIIYTVPSDLAGYRITEIQATVFGTGRTLTVELERRRGANVLSVVSVNIPNGTYTNNNSVSGTTTVNAGDILRINPTLAAGTATAPNGLTCTITFTNN